MEFREGPYVQMAAFCEQVIEDKTGVLSPIRIIDALTQTAAGPEPPLDMPSFSHSMKLLIMLKSGRAQGRHEIKIIPQSPSAETQEPFVRSVQLEGEERGVNIIANMTYTFDMEGVYWFNVYFDDSLLTKIPFRVRYERIVIGRPTPPSV